MKRPAKFPTRPGRALHRLFGQQVDLALRHLRDPEPAQRAHSIHEARKCLKQLRALVRLLRRWLGPTASRRENERLRQLARELAPERDAAALLEALEALPRRASLRAALKQARLELAARLPLPKPTRRRAGPPGTRRMQQVLVRLRARLEGWGWSQLTWADLQAGLRRTYRAGRRAFDRARESASTEDLHDWRKPVKFLALQLTTLAALRIPVDTATIRALQRSAADCGQEHDLALLADFLARHCPHLPAGGSLLREAAQRRRELITRALRRGRHVYTRKSGAFARRIFPA